MQAVLPGAEAGGGAKAQRTRSEEEDEGVRAAEISHVVHLGDCLDPVSGLASLPDRSVDHVIMDPPYSEHVHRKLGNESRNDGVRPRAPLTFDAMTDEMASALANEMARAARRWTLIFGDEQVMLTLGRAVRCAAI